MIKPCHYCGEPYEPVTVMFFDGHYCAVCIEKAMQEAIKMHHGYGMINDYFLTKDAIKIYEESRGKKSD